MWYKYIKTAQQKKEVYKHPLDIPMDETLTRILQDLSASNMRGLIVGGAVRDQFFGLPSKDIDVEVYNTTYDDLAKILSQYGRTDLVGKSFGVIKLTDKEGNNYDFSVPRRDNKIGVGHTGFKTTFDPSITPKEAAARRDFTLNSIAYDPLTQEVHDYYGGIDDINNGILRATSPAFAEDPLRVLRGMQLASRLNLDVEPETAKMIANMPQAYEAQRPQLIQEYVNGGREALVNDYVEERNQKIAEFASQNPNATQNEINKRFPLEIERRFPSDPEKMFAPNIHDSLATERIAEEWMKLATKGKHPGKAMEFLHNTGWDQFYPEISALKGVPQDPEWHPEGEVFDHTKHVMNAAANIADREKLSPDDRATLILSALTHDFAKPETTMQREKDGKMRWTAHGHEAAGGPITEEFLKRIGINRELINRIRPLVENHLNHIGYKATVPDTKHLRNLAYKLHPGTIKDLTHLIEADHSGRPPLPVSLPEQAKRLYEHAQQDNVHMGPPQSLVQGRHVMPYYGNKGGPYIGEAVKDAYTAQLNGKINNEAQANDWLNNYLRIKAALIRGQHILPYFDNQPGPHIGEVAQKAWEAQNAGEFSDQDSANEWLKNHVENSKPEG